MNERGLAVGMMAVPSAQAGSDSRKVTIDSLAAIRLLLDKAQSVDEALSLLGAYNIDWGSGPPLHYLIADSTWKLGGGRVRRRRDEGPAQRTAVAGGHQLCPVLPQPGERRAAM